MSGEDANSQTTLSTFRLIRSASTFFSLPQAEAERVVGADGEAAGTGPGLDTEQARAHLGR